MCQLGKSEPLDNLSTFTRPLSPPPPNWICWAKTYTCTYTDSNAGDGATLKRHIAVQYAESPPIFQRIMSPSSSGIKISRASNQQKADLGFLFGPEEGTTCSTFTRLNGIMSEETDVFITVTVRISRPMSVVLPTSTGCRDPRADSASISHDLCHFFLTGPN